MGRAGRLAWALVGGFVVLLLVRLLQGARLGPAPDPAWGLKVLWHHGSTPQAFALAGVLAGVAAIAWAAGRLARRDDPTRPLSWGAPLFFAVGLADAVAGTWLHFVREHPTSFVPAILHAARCAALTVALPALFLRLRGLGSSFVPPGLALSLLGVGLYLAPLEPPLRPRRGNDAALRLVSAGLALTDLREQHPGLHDIRRRIVEAGEDGVDALLDVPGDDVYWTWHHLLEFGPDAVPALLRGLSRPDPMARKRAVRALTSRAHDPEVARAVLPLLSDPDPWTRCFAARFFSDDSDDEKLRTPAVALPEAVDPLRALLRDPDDQVRLAAVAALRHQGLHATWPDLRNLLRFETDREVREEAHESLLMLATPDAFRLLLQGVSKECSHNGKPAFPADAGRVAVDLLHLPSARSFLTWDRYDDLRLPARQVDRLLAAATSTETELRRAALGALSRLDDPRAIGLCRAALGTPDAGLVLRGLRRRGRATAEEVVRNLFHYTPEPADVDLLEPLEAVVHDPGAPRNRAAIALQDLHAIDPDRAARAAQCLYEMDPTAAAGRGLIFWFPKAELPRLLDSPDPRVAREALNRLDNADDPRAARVLVDALRAAAPSDRYPLIQMAARSRVRDASPVLCEIAASTPWPIGRGRDHAHLTLVIALGEIGDPGAAETLRDLLRQARDQNLPRLIAAAATALVNAGDRTELPSLLDLAFGAGGSGGCACGSDVVCRAVRALARAGELGALLEAAEDSRTRIAALEALGLAKTRGPLLKSLEHLRPAVRRAAALGLGHLADPDTLEELRKAVDDPSPKVREAARWAVQRITGVDAGLRMSRRDRHMFEER